MSSSRLDSVAKCLRSVLVTCRGGITLGALEREYMLLVGEELPYRRLGFGSLLDLLVAVPEVARVEESRDAMGNAAVLVHVVTDEKSKHVRKFVMAQKSTEKDRRPVNRRPDDPRFKKNAMATRTVPQSVKGKIAAVLEQVDQWLPMSQFDSMYRRKYGCNIEFGVYGFDSLTDLMHSLKRQQLCHMALINEQWQLRGPQQKVNKRPQERPNQRRAIHTRPESRTQEFNQSVNHTIEEDQYSMPTVPKAVRDNLSAIIQNHSQGLTLNELTTLYEEETRQKLNVRELGFTALDELLLGAHEVCRCEVQNYQCIVYPPKSLETPQDVGSQEKTLPSANKLSTTIQPSSSTRNEILANIRNLLQLGPVSLKGFQERFFQHFGFHLSLESLGYSDLKHFLQNISFVELNEPGLGRDMKAIIVRLREDANNRQERSNKPSCSLEEDKRTKTEAIYHVQSLPSNLSVNSKLKVVIGEVFSPLKFFFLLFDCPNYSTLENKLMVEIHDFYNQEQNVINHKLSMRKVNRGTFVAALYPPTNKWHRGFVRSVEHGRNKLDIVFIDYGSLAKVKIENCLKLDSAFCSLPSQAIEARLFGVMPNSEDNEWSSEATETILKLCLEDGQGYLEATFKGFKSARDCNRQVCLELKKPNDIKTINQILIEQKLAKKEDTNLSTNMPLKQALPKVDGEFNLDKSSNIQKFESTSTECDDLIQRLQKIKIKTVPSEKESKGSGNDTSISVLIEDPPKIHEGPPFVDAVAKPTAIHASPERLLRPAWGKKIFVQVGTGTEKSIFAAKLNNTFHVTSSSISSLLEEFKGRDLLQIMLKMKRCADTFHKLEVQKSGCERLFSEGQKLGVPGFSSEIDVCAVTLYPLREVPAILRRVSTTPSAKTLSQSIQRECQRLEQDQLL